MSKWQWLVDKPVDKYILQLHTRRLARWLRTHRRAGRGALPGTRTISSQRMCNMANMDRRRARSSFPPATLRFVAKLAVIVAPEWLTASRSPVPGFMAMVTPPVKPSRRRRTGLQCRRDEGHATHAAPRLDKHPRGLCLLHASHVRAARLNAACHADSRV